MSFEILPRDVLLLILAKVGDPSKLFCCSKYLNEFGKKHQLRAKEVAIKELNRIAPYADIIGCPQCNLAMLKRGQETAYTAILDYQDTKPNHVQRGRVYSIDGFVLGLLRYQKFDGAHPYFSLKGPPARKGSKISLFGAMIDKSYHKSDGDGGYYEISKSYFEFEYATAETLEKTALWPYFCKASIDTAYERSKDLLDLEQWKERELIRSEFDRLKEEKNNKEEKKEEKNENLEEDPFNETEKEKDIYRRLSALDETHRKFQTALEEQIYANRELVVKLSKEVLLEKGEYAGYIFGVYPLLNK